LRRLAEIVDALQRLAPLSAAEPWDNVGLLVGDASRDVERVMTCLTLTSDVAAEAVREGAQLVVSHHPVLFRPVQQITRGTAEGGVLLDLIQAGIAVYSAHTAYDSACTGINQQLAELFELRDVVPLRPFPAPPADLDTTTALPPGSGRCGQLPRALPLTDVVQLVKQRLGVAHLQFVGEDRRPVERLGVACGSAAEYFRDAHRLGCQVLVTGEARFHDCLAAREIGMGLILAGHYATERPAMLLLAKQISDAFPDLSVQASAAESDPIRWS